MDGYMPSLVPTRKRERTQGPPRGDEDSGVVIIRVRNQGQEARALDGGRELALVLGLGAGDAAGDDLAGLGQVLAQGVEILVVDLFHALGGELAELAAAEELGHLRAPKKARGSGGFGGVVGDFGSADG